MICRNDGRYMLPLMAISVLSSD